MIQAVAGAEATKFRQHSKILCKRESHWAAAIYGRSFLLQVPELRGKLAELEAVCT